MAMGEKPEVPGGTPDEVELLLRWLGYLRGAVLRKAEGSVTATRGGLRKVG